MRHSLAAPVAGTKIYTLNNRLEIVRRVVTKNPTFDPNLRWMHNHIEFVPVGTEALCVRLEACFDTKREAHASRITRLKKQIHVHERHVVNKRIKLAEWETELAARAGGEEA